VSAVHVFGPSASFDHLDPSPGPVSAIRTFDSVTISPDHLISCHLMAFHSIPPSLMHFSDAYTLSGSDPEGAFPSILGHEGGKSMLGHNPTCAVAYGTPQGHQVEVSSSPSVLAWITSRLETMSSRFTLLVRFRASPPCRCLLTIAGRRRRVQGVQVLQVRKDQPLRCW
jgi:hypothetical protein